MSNIEYPPETTVSKTFNVFSLNVHGWTNPSDQPTQLIDYSVKELVKKLQPDVCCFQEVKHPFPTEPIQAQHLVRITEENKTLLRYSKDEDTSDIEDRLNIPSSILSPEEKKFFEDRDYRNKKRYLDYAFPANSKIKCKPPKSTSLSNIAEAMGAKMDNIHFTPAYDETFGNAIIFKSNGIVESTKLVVEGREVRAATKVIVETGLKFDLAVINVHLDHQLEEVRIQQIKILFEWLNSHRQGMSQLPHLLVGDFNAVSYWTPEVVEARKKNNLQPSTDDLYRLLTETYGYVDLETNNPPRNTSTYNVRVDYILCSQALMPRIQRDKTQFQVIGSDSDHSAVLGNIEFNVSKLMIGVQAMMQIDAMFFCEDLTEILREKGIGGRIELITDDFTEVMDFTEVFEKFQFVDTIIVDGPEFSLLPSLDFLFVVQYGEMIKSFSPKMITVTSKDEIIYHMENYLKFLSRE